MGVIASLIFVAVEIRQNTEAVKSATVQAVAQQSMDLVLAGIDNPDLREAFYLAAREEPLTQEQSVTLDWFFQAKLRADENRFRQVELGILERSTFGQLSNHAAYRLPLFPDWWERQGGAFSPDFGQFVEEEFVPLAETEPLVRNP